MPLKALLFDFRVLAPLEINYAKATQALKTELADVLPSGARPWSIFDQISLLLDEKKKKKISAKRFNEISEKISKNMEELELEQVAIFPLYAGVKNGLASVKTMKLSVISTTEIGVAPAEKFLREKEIESFFSDTAPRRELAEAVDMGLRLRPLFEKLEVKPEESLYFCNRLRDLKAAQSLGVRIIVMPGGSESIDALLREKPEGMIISLEELPTMLSLKSFKGPEAKAKEKQMGKNEREEEEEEDEDSPSEKSVEQEKP